MEIQATRLALARCEISVRDAEGTETGSYSGAQISVRDGMARIKTGAEWTVEMPLTGLVQTARRVYEISGPDQTWFVSRKCNCGGGR